MIKYSEHEKEAINVALLAIQKTLYNNDAMQSSKEVKNYLKIQLPPEPDEQFAVLFLDSPTSPYKLREALQGHY
mgnify:CR=1 FL=1